jgi:hypothetical protein
MHILYVQDISMTVLIYIPHVCAMLFTVYK